MTSRFKIPPMPRIVVDTREQQPYGFENITIKGKEVRTYEIIRKALKSGDYSLEGLEQLISIERKSKEDAYNSLGCGRARLREEMQRLLSCRFSAIVIECSLKSFLSPPPYSQLNPKSAINTLNSWAIQYRVHVHFCGSRKSAMAMTLSYLRHFWRLYNEEKLDGAEQRILESVQASDK